MRNFYFIAVLGLLFVGCSVDNDEIVNEEIGVADVTVCDVTAGADNSITLTNEYVMNNLYTPARLERYFKRLLDEGVPTDGTFSPSMESLILSYQDFNFQTFTTVYTVGEGGCTDFTELSIVVVEKIEEPSTCFIGDDIYQEVENKFIQENIGNDPVKLKNYYLGLLNDEVPLNGTFSPEIATIGNSYLRDNYQTFTTVYTVDFGDCTDSVKITVKVLPACAGEDKFVTRTNSFVQNNLYTPSRLRRFYLRMLDSGVSVNGTFTPSMETLIQSYQKDNFQVFTTTYTVDEEECSDSTKLSIEVIE
ncbi:hypothetical protein [Christiangramia sp. SM2212]|uniref:FHA domain-containing protein n=1 Tax=Christiangramia sediminicola TaxID=3073267 RepID=A0ABU1ET43_9FLAO|nr:hypothetical protein [Christiangramia sp. SM2212]MDR5591570.1 hypothetical protein [Christiangramia sp. SM2212]